MNRTERALLARGIDALTAQKVSNNGYTLGKLKSSQPLELKAIGLTDKEIKIIQSESRPPIPTSTLTKVLFNNRFMCCICRDKSQPIILHHIEPWEKSRSHSETNLSVLCLNHHDAAHTKKELSRSLDKSSIKHAKNMWEDEVRNLDATSIIRCSSMPYNSWAYFNHIRLFEMADALNVNLKQCVCYRELLHNKIINEYGLFLPRPKDSYYMYEGSEILMMHYYTKSIMEKVLKKSVVINISDYMDKGTIPNLLANGDLIFVQGAHSFKKLTKSYQGQNQTTSGERSANKVTVKFTIDKWEALSSSAHSTWLSGRVSAGTLLQVRSLEREDGKLVIQGTAIGIANGWHDLKTRDYMSHVGRFIDYEEEEEEEFS